MQTQYLHNSVAFYCEPGSLEINYLVYNERCSFVKERKKSIIKEKKEKREWGKKLKYNAHEL